MIPLLLFISLHLSVQTLPQDTLIVDGVPVIGVAVPNMVLYIPGDFNGDGRRSSADVILLVRDVFMNERIPVRGDTVGVQICQDSIWYTFIRTHGVGR